MTLVPKIASRFGIDASGRFVQQKQARPMNQAGGEREPLLPSPRKMTGEFIFTLGQPELFQALPHGLAPIFEVIHPRHKIEIFLNAQIFPKAESLRHVADLAFDRFALVDNIVTETSAA